MITGAYKSTNNEKLLKLIGELSIDEELILKDALSEVGKESRKTIKEKMKDLYLKEMKSFDHSATDLQKCPAKYSIWCISGNGPFKSHLCKLGIVDNDWCRYCKMVPETPIHLLYECSMFKINIKLSEKAEEIEFNCENLCKKLIRDRTYRTEFNCK